VRARLQMKPGRSGDHKRTILYGKSSVNYKCTNWLVTLAWDASPVFRENQEK
jgi:hypothetical protein